MSQQQAIAAALTEAAERIGGNTAELDARLLLAHSLNQPTSYLQTWPEKALTNTQQAQFEHLIDQRSAGQPVAYLLGSQGFWTLDLAVNPDTLIPRPETELLVELALDISPEPTSIIDLGTGSGAIALALAKEKPDWAITATDFSKAALATARNNAQRNAIGTVIEFVESSWFEQLDGLRYDLIVSNPPYVAEQDPHLEALKHEPISALTSGPDGLNAISQIVVAAPRHLNTNGWLLIEHGHDQGGAIRELFRENFSNVSTKQDLAGLDRVTLGQLKTR